MQSTVKLTGADGKLRTWFIKAAEIKVVDDKLFWNVKTWYNPTRRLLTHYVGQPQKKPRELYKIMSSTDVIQQIAKVKRGAMHRAVSGGQTTKAKRWRPLKRQTKNLLTLPEYMPVHAPDIGSVKGVDINVLSKNALWIELTHESLMYITKAMNAQIEAGGVGEGKRRGKKRLVDLTHDGEEAEPHHDEEGGATLTKAVK